MTYIDPLSFVAYISDLFAMAYEAIGSEEAYESAGQIT